MIRTPLVRPAALLAITGAIVVPIATASARSSAGTKVSLRRTELGMILVSSRGRTLYAFTKDARDKDRCVTTAGCTGAWPVVSTKAQPRAGRGVKASKLSSIKLGDGARQVTYNGRPLYTYVGDETAGDPDYVGAVQFGGTWLAVNPAGGMVR